MSICLIRSFRARPLYLLLFSLITPVLLTLLLLSVTPGLIHLETRILQLIFEIRGSRPPPTQVLLVAIDQHGNQQLGLDPFQQPPIKLLATLLERIASGRPSAMILDFELGGDRYSPHHDQIINTLSTSPSTLPRGDVNEADAAVSYRLSCYDFESSPVYNSARLHIPMSVWRTGGLSTDIRSALPQTSTSLYDQVPLLRPIHSFLGLAPHIPNRGDLINFYGPPGSINSISYSILLDAPEPLLRYYLEGRFVLVGMVGVETQRSDGDLHPTIGSLQSMAGVEIHASIAGNLLDGSWIHRASPDLSLSIALSVASLSLALGLALPASIGSLCGLLALAIATLASYITVTQYHLFVLGLSVVGGSVLTLMFLQLARLIVARSP